MVTVEPIRDPQKLAEIKRRLKRRDARYYAFFTLGLNTALRPGDLLKLKAGDVYDEFGKVKSLLYVTAQKTGKRHRIKLNDAAREALEHLWASAVRSRDKISFSRGRGNTLGGWSIGGAGKSDSLRGAMAGTHYARPGAIWPASTTESPLSSSRPSWGTLHQR